ncbi:MAG: hypothetical protein JWR83_2994 [Aeromicrobium sp.]|nr:hypothetical protein [Aeromicrobium sp.]
MTDAPTSPPEQSGGDTGPPFNRKALACIVLGAASFLCLFVFPFGALALGIPALTTGIHARREIADSKEPQEGDSWAVTGLIVGGAGLLFGIVALGLSALPHS